MKIHFLGIGGVGMAALAVLLKGEGHEISGCDAHPGARTRWLESLGIKCGRAHDASHAADADIVIATPAVRRDNPEFMAASAAGKLRWRGSVLAELASRRETIAVCGSHGKTTTATFTAKLLRELGEDVAWGIGGETGAFPVAGCGNGPLVVEADESDGTLAEYHAALLVVTNCEYDHPDHFKTPEDYAACFDAARANAKETIECGELDMSGWDIPALGEHNKRNARAAAEVALRRHWPREAVEKALAKVVGELPDRRFQRLAQGVYTDYAHHPTEIACAVSMAREATSPGRVLRVLFQPHRYSRTKALAKEFPVSLKLADEIVICPTYAAFEEPMEGGGSADLYAAVRETLPEKKVMLAKTCEEAWRHARIMMEEGDVTLLLGAGSIIELAPEAAMFKVAAKCQMRDLSALSFFRTGGMTMGGGAKHIVGMGSNLWISDLATDEEYIRTPFPAARPGATLGIPWMAGIPGSIGGWTHMNAGAFGHSFSEVVRRVKANGGWLDKQECAFGYRTSAIKGEIEDVELDEKALAAAKADKTDYLSRRKKFPPRTCGSVFKNPPGDHAGRLLEAVGAKGMRVGGAYVWQDHANVIAAGDGANSSDILALAEILREKVRLRFGVSLEYEICGMS